MTEAQFAELFAVLCQIRDALVPPVEDPDAPCEHPEESRVDFGYTKGQPHWMCKTCRYEHVVE